MPDLEKWVRVNPSQPDPKIVQKAGEIIRSQGVVVFPAQTLYGLAANALDAGAVKRIFELKQRPESKPILILVKNREEILGLVKSIPRNAQILMDRFWPGSLTLVFEASPALPPVLTAHTGKIGIRVPAQPVAKALARAAGYPITGTSANQSGSPGCTDPIHLPESMIQGADLILDAGPLKGGPGSTVLDVTANPVTILREGAISKNDILSALKTGK